MRTSSFLKATFLGAALLGAAAGFAPEAKAMDEGQCMSAADFKAQRVSENQKILFLSDQRLIGSAPRDLGTFVLADREGGTGYVVQSDKPYTEAAGQICVLHKLYSAHVNFSKSVPIELIEGTNITAAQKDCDALISNGVVGKGNCHPLETVINDALKIGSRPLIWGTKANGIKVIVDAEVSDNGEPTGDVPGAGAITLSTASGATAFERPLRQATLNNDAFKTLLGQKEPRVAQNTTTGPVISFP